MKEDETPQTPVKIEIRGLVKNFRHNGVRVEVLTGVDLDIHQSETLAVVGASGVGKSTLLHILGCMDVPTSGEIQLNGQRLGEIKERELTQIRAKVIGFIFQAFHLNSILTVRENVAIALHFLGISKAEANRKAESCLQRVGMGHRLSHYPSELSGGERQRVAIARALVKNPKLILADEPTGNLDTKIGMEIIALIRKINREEGTTIIQVTHDPDVAGVADEIIKLRDGQIGNPM